MTLVNYSSSEDEGIPKTTTDTQTDRTVGIKRKREAQEPDDLPPLPSKFHSLYASAARVSTTDNPSLHGGRKRVTPHVEGSWPTHLYIEWCPLTAEYSVMNDLIAGLIERNFSENFTIHSFLHSDLGAPLPLHISLSRPIVFLTEVKDQVVERLEQLIRTRGIRPFDVTISSVDWVSNFEKTRWFLVLRLQKPSTDGLNKLLHLSNHVVQSFGQPPLYAKTKLAEKSSLKRAGRPNNKKADYGQTTTKVDWSGLEDASDAFHISIAWTLTAPSQQMRDITTSRFQIHVNELSQIHVHISEIKAKVGNAVTNVALRTNVTEGVGSFG